MKSAHIAALLLVFGAALIRPGHGAAQLGLGSLVVNITSPASGSTIGGTVPVSASVTIVGALTVRGVQFKLDGVNLGAEDTTAPYSISWNTKTAMNGTHTLTAVARDLLGVAFTSNPVTVTVFNDTIAPTIAGTTQMSGATLSGTTTIGASASVNVGVAGVQFRLDGVNFGAEDTSAPYSVPWDTTTASSGTHTLTAVARDAAGNVATSAVITVTVSNDATPPTIAITAPAAGALLRGTATVSATASDNVGVAGVQFRLDGVNLGAEDTTAPYSVPWNTTTAANGSHTLTAVARDAAGNVTTSAAVGVTVDNAIPTVTITAPASGSTVSGTVSVTASASDNTAVAGVQFRLDGAALGAEDTSAPYSVPWDTTTASSGTHTLTAVARDGAGNVATSAAITVTVSNDATPPTVAITAPAADALLRGTATVSATASDNVGVAGVQFRLDGANLGAEDTTAPYSVPWNTTTAANGSHTLTAVARDAAGNLATSVAVAVTVDNAVPAVAITAPASGATVSGSVTVTATASDNSAVAGVQFRLDGAALGAEDTSAPYSVPWDTTTASSGTHTLTAVARDAAGNVATSATVTVTVSNDATPPTVAITAPAAGATVRGTTTVSATVSDNVGVAGVQFRLDGANLGAEDTTAPYSVPWNTTTAVNGSHTLTAVARDTSGNLATSGAVAVTVDNAVPTVAITAPASGATVSGTVSVTASASDNTAIAGVQFRLDGAALGAEDTSAPYSVPWDTTTATDGAHTLTAVARDAAGNSTTSATVTVTADNGAPTVAITAPAAGATVSGQIAVAASASDGSGIAGVQFRLDGANLGGEDTTAPYSVSWDTTTAADGSHTLTAVARDTSGATATSTAVTVTVSNATGSVTRVQDSSTSIAYAGSWALGNTAKAWSGGTAALATAGPSATGDPTRATLTFTGTGVRWIGFTGPQTGIARVLLDGVVVATVDTYAPTETLEAVLYTATGLASTAHTLAIESTGTKNVASSDIFVIVDAFDVTSAGGGADTTPPSVAITTPASGSTASGTIVVAASASDGGGIAGVQFRLNGVALQGEDTTAPYSINWDTTTVGDGTHSLTAVARDTAGNAATSTAVTVTVSNGTAPPSPGMTRFEDTDPSIIYTPGSAAVAPPAWWHGSRSRGWSGETSSFNRSEGARATFTFTGTSVSWIGFRAPWAGIARVFVDDVFATELDLHSSTEQPQAAVFTASGLAPGSHTIAVEVTSRKNVAATDNAVVVDAFDVGPATPPRVTGARIEETAPSVTFSGTWTVPGGGAAWSGGSASESSTAGSRATLIFTGNTVSLIGLRGPRMGIARIYLDGSFQATVDTFAATEIQTVIFTETNLAAGTHELSVEVSGLKNAAATDHRIVVDAFDVRTRVEEVDAAVTYTGGWSPQNFDEAWSGTSPNYGSGSATRSATAGARAELRFVGTRASWIGYRGPHAGIARVLIDGVLAGEVDAYAPVKQVRAELFATPTLSAGSHTITIEVTGLKNAASTNAIVIVDAFDVSLPTGMPPVTRFQQTDAAYPVGPWEQSSPNPLFSGGTVASSATAGARAEFTFTGSGVRWIGQRTFAGRIASVFLDGVRVADVNTVAAVQEEFQAVLFSASGLSAGTHTLSIELLPDTALSGGRLIVDAFDVIR